MKSEVVQQDLGFEAVPGKSTVLPAPLAISVSRQDYPTFSVKENSMIVQTGTNN